MSIGAEEGAKTVARKATLADKKLVVYESTQSQWLE